MLFSSTTFLYLFLPMVLAVYYILLRKFRTAQNIFLFLASIGFYAWGEPRFVLIMAASIVINWILGLWIDSCRGKTTLSRMILGVDVAVNLGLLFVFKYLNFTADILKDLLGVELGIPQITLPIGISFFTFQAMSYVIDVYRGKGQVQKNILYVGLYVAFFPQLIAGPIVRYETIADQIQNRRETLNDVTEGFSRFIIGLAKKVLLSNHLALLADAAFCASASGEMISVGFSWLGALAYTMQIFFDFSGYSDMAIGLGRMFGFHFLENFNYPYISASISEFWRRWHMSLGSWFRDYVYFPLGGSRVCKGRLVFNLFVVWSLTGLWHGANFTFILWGMMYFLLLTFEKMTGFEKKNGPVLNVLKRVYTILFVILGWVLFRAESIGDAMTYMGSMFGVQGNALTDGCFTGYLAQNAIILFLGGLLCTPIAKAAARRIKPNLLTDLLYAASYLLLFILSIASLASSSYNPFIYFNF